MKRHKIGISILIICLFVLPYVFSATATPVYIESRLYFYPKSVVDNKSQAIDLTSNTKYLTTSSYNNDGVTLLTSPNNLAIFRISENLMPHKSVYQSVSDKVTTGVDLRVTSLTNWEFVKEDNPTQRVSFSIDAFCTQYKWNSTQNKYVADNPVSIPHTFENNSESSYNYYGGGNSNTTITSTKTTSGSVCTILMPYTPVATSVSTQGNVTMYARIPKYKRDFDICIHITGDTSSLPQGYYYTTLEYSVTGYYESPVEFKSGNQVSLPGNDDPSSCTGTITVWAYVGDVLNGFNDYSFAVTSAADTFSMVLGKTEAQPTAPAYDVASVHFYYLEQVNTSPNQSVQEQKFRIYISPTADYNAPGQYRFIKMNTEGQGRNDKNTIYYDLGLKDSQGNFKTFSNLGNSTLQGDIGSAGVYANNTYVITPKYNSIQTAASSSYKYGNQTIIVGEDCFTQSWILEQEIYLKVTDDSYDANHLAGMYYSWIYLTLVAD